MNKPLRPHELKVWKALLAKFAEELVKADIEDQFRAPCPAHEGEGLNMVAYIKEDEIRFRCYSHQCTHEEIRDSLGLKESDLKLGTTVGCTLKEYAEFKQLSVSNLLDFELGGVNYAGKRAVRIPYFDRKKKKTGYRLRVSLDGKKKVISPKGGNVQLYGAWKFDEAIAKNFVVIVEGESDCHTLWSHSIPALGIPGAQQVNLVLPELQKLLEEAPDLMVYIVEEPDEGGKSFVRLFSRTDFRDRINVIGFGDFKDPSEMHIDDPDDFEDRFYEAQNASVPLIDAIVGYGVNSLADLRPEVEKLLSGSCGWSCKKQIAQLIGDFLLSQGRLLKNGDFQDSSMYLLIDDEAIHLSLDEFPVRLALQKTGLNPSDNAFNFVFNELAQLARSEGRLVEIHQYSLYKDEKLYVSAGPKRLVVYEVDEVGDIRWEVQPNGFDGILFASDFCFAVWEPDKPLPPWKIQVLSPKFGAPPEAPDYRSWPQEFLSHAWMAGVLAGYKLPIMTCLGSMDSGKSHFLKAVCRLFHGISANVSNVPGESRAFFSGATSAAVYALDNLDDPPGSWFADDLAGATTGMDFATRALYSNNRMFRRIVTARFACSTRTASFAKRADIRDRVFPLFFQALPDKDKWSETKLFEQFAASRNGVLTWLGREAFQARLIEPMHSGLQSRFQEFANVAESMAMYHGDFAERTLKQMIRAQQFAVRDLDQILEALLNVDHELQGNATNIGDLLRREGYRIPKLAGKPMARKLREAKRMLQLAERDIIESTRGGTSYFRLVIGEEGGKGGK